MTTTFGAPGASSLRSITLPSSARAPSRLIMLAVTTAVRTRTGSSAVMTLAPPSSNNPIAASSGKACCRWRYCAVDRFHSSPLPTPGTGFLRRTSRSGSGYGSGSSTTRLSTVYMDAVAPIPSPSVSTTAAANPGRRRSERAPRRRSRNSPCHASLRSRRRTVTPSIARTSAPILRMSPKRSRACRSAASRESPVSISSSIRPSRWNRSSSFTSDSTSRLPSGRRKIRLRPAQGSRAVIGRPPR
jgi:hypothetical protein